MKITINRNLTKGEYTHGHLTIDGIRVCHTLENSQALVPAGTYTVTLLKCKQYSRKMLCLNPKAPCTLCKKSLNSQPSSLNFTLPCWCPQIKPGNGIHNRLDGSILVGQSQCSGLIIHSKKTFDSLYERIRKSISRGNEVTVTIKDVPSTLSPHPSTKIFV